MQSVGLLTDVEGVPSFWLQNDRLELHCSQQGAMLAPARFKLKHRWVSPYAVAPWFAEEHDAKTSIALQQLRGSFLAAPFNSTGGLVEPSWSSANREWKLENATVRSLHLSTEFPAKGSIHQEIMIDPDTRAIYLEAKLEDFSGRLSIAWPTHLRYEERGAQWSCSAFDCGMVRPIPLGEPEQGTYSSLRAGSGFHSLENVPGIDGSMVDVRQLPHVRGFDDVIQLCGPNKGMGWAAVTMDGYLWIALWPRSVFPALLLWFVDGGSHPVPWCGRLRRWLGIYPCNALFDYPIHKSERNRLKECGCPTGLSFGRGRSQTIRMVHAVHQVPRNFGRVEEVTPDKDQEALLVCNEEGKEVLIPMRVGFLGEI